MCSRKNLKVNQELPTTEELLPKFAVFPAVDSILAVCVHAVV